MKELIAALLIVLATFSLCSMLSSSTSYINRLQSINDDRDRGFLILDDVSEKMQDFANQGCDILNSDVATSIKEYVDDYLFDMFDVSSGINTILFPDQILSSPIVQNYLKEDIQSRSVSYGWMNSNFPNTKLLESSLKSFTQTNDKSLFPLVNSYPLVNVYYLSDDCIRVLLSASG